MLIANRKLRTNIAEYILYMWQIEDIIRAKNFDEQELTAIAKEYSQEEYLWQEIANWYIDLSHQMIAEKIQVKGHLAFLNRLLVELEKLHSQILQLGEEPRYLKIYEETLPAIKDLRSKSNNNRLGDIELCFNGLYAKMLLSLKKQDLNEKTKDAIQNFSALVSMLTFTYHRQKKTKGLL